MRIALTRAAHASKRDRDTATHHHVTPQRIDATEFLTRGHLDSTHIQIYQYQTQGAKDQQKYPEFPESHEKTQSKLYPKGKQYQSIDR